MVVILIPSWKAVILGSVLFLSWTAISLPATMGLVARVLPSNKRTMGVSMHSLVRRIPMALGPLVGGAFIGLFGEVWGVRLAFVAALLMAGVALVAQQRLIEDDPPKKGGTSGAEKNPLRLYALMSPDLKNLLVADILVRFCEQIPYAFVVLWAMKEISSPVSAFQFGLLTTVEMIVAMLVYIPVATMADRMGKKPFVALTFVFFTLFPAMLYFSRSFGALAAAFVVRGAQGVRRTHAQGTHHGPCAGGAQGGHVRSLLPASGHRGLRGGLRRRLSVDDLAGTEFLRRLRLRPGGNRVVHPERTRPTRASDS